MRRLCKTIVFILLTIVMSASCESNLPQRTSAIIELDDNENKRTLSSLMDVDTIFALKAGSLTETNKILLRDDKVYVLDEIQKRLYVFNLSGDSIGIIDQIGHARNEYINITDFDVTQGSIAIFDSESSKILTYNHQGNLISALDAVYGDAIVAQDPANFVIIDDSDVTTLHLIGDKDGEYSLERTSSIPTGISYHGRLYHDGEDLLFTRQFDNTIYHFNGHGISPFLELDFKEYQYEPQTWKGLSAVDAVQRLIKTNEIIYISHVCKCGHYISFFTNQGQSVVYDTDTNESLVLSNLKIPHSVLLGNPISINNDRRFVSWIAPDNVQNALLPLVEDTAIISKYPYIASVGNADEEHFYWCVIGKMKD